MSSLKKQSSERVAQLAGHLESLLASDASLDPNPTDSEVEEPLPRTEWDAELDELKRRIQLARTVPDSDPGKLRQAKQGKLMVRDRVDKMLDKNSLVEVGSIAGKGEYNADGEIVGFTRANYVSGYGTLDGRRVVVGGDDFSVRGGHADGAIWRKAQYTEQMAREMRVPLIRLLDGSSGGGSVASILKQGYSYIPPSVKMEWMIKLMTDVPVVAACLGPAVGLAAAKATLTHFSVMCESDIGSLFAAGPPVVIEATHENVTKTQLGGPLIHTRNGTIDNAAKTEAECFETLRRFLSYLPSSRFEMTPSLPYTGSRNNFGRGGLMLGDDGAALMAAIPHNRKKPYDPKLYVERIVDEGTLFETGPDWGKEHRTFLARLNGRPVGVLASDPRFGGAALTAMASAKIGRLVTICAAFKLPILNFVDCPGFAIGTRAEKEGTIRAGSRLACVMFESKIPYFTVLARKCFGVAGSILANPGQGNTELSAGVDFRVGWPMIEAGSLPIEGGIEAAFKGELAAIGDPVARAARKEQIDREIRQFMSPQRTAEAFDLEELIDPRRTRSLMVPWVERMYAVRLPQLIALESSRMDGWGPSGVGAKSTYLP